MLASVRRRPRPLLARASAVLLATVLLSTGCSGPAEAADVSTKLVQYPLVGQHNPRWRFLRDYSDETIAAVFARYDAIVANSSVIQAENILVLNKVYELNPLFVLALQWPMKTKGSSGCTTESLQRLQQQLKRHLISLGEFKLKLDAIELDGAGNVANDCSNGVSKVKSALTAYRKIITDLQMPALLTVNGAHFPTNVDSCGYAASKDGFGSWGFPGLQKMTSGPMKEGWTDRIKWLPGQRPNIGGLLDEVCAWHARALRPTVVYGLGFSCTPWWRLPTATRCRWKKSRLAFAAAQMYDRTLHIHTAAQQDPDDLANASHMFWLDYHAVNWTQTTPPTPPSPGDDRLEPVDDALDEQRAGSGYLGAPGSRTRKALTGGGAMVREFACGFVVANWSTQSWTYTPPVRTQLIKGRQDPAYDDGSSWQRYSIPPKDGRVLIKKSCLSPSVQSPTTTGTWRPQA